MSDIAALEGRITAALDRIREGVARQSAPVAVQAPTADTDALRMQLDEERTANAQLEERLRRLKDHQDGAISDLEGRAASHAAILAGMEAEVQRLRASNADLRDMTAQLRSAAADGATSPELINRATIAEIEALQAQRTSEAAEMDAIVSSLKPLIEEA
ncbi:MAG: hypothetical protein KC448_00630 [Yoonia sp.]|nr:hypothetical protein [Yoonia sp.]